MEMKIKNSAQLFISYFLFTIIAIIAFTQRWEKMPKLKNTQ